MASYKTSRSDHYFDRSLFASADEARRWRLVGYVSMAASTVLACSIYWNIGLGIAEMF
jgi:hypothetical protein